MAGRRPDRLKLKRTIAWRLAIGAPLTIVLLNFIMVSQPRTAGRSEDELLGFAQLTLTTWTIVVLPRADASSCRRDVPARPDRPHADSHESLS